MRGARHEDPADRRGRRAAYGAFSGVTLGFFDPVRRDYARRVIREQVEVVSLLGNVALDGGEPRIHVHVAVARYDGSALGGHLLGGVEVIIVESPGRLRRKTDPATLDVGWNGS